MGKRVTEIRKGMCVEYEGGLCMVIDYEHHTPGNLRAIINIKLKNLKTGSVKVQRFGSGDVLEVAYLDTKECQYLYKDKTTGKYVFMDQESYEQYEIDEAMIGGYMPYVVEEQVVQVKFHEHTPLSVELPSSVNLKITESEPSSKGNSVSNLFKRAVCQTGLEIKVPLHIGVGELVRISTETGEFLGRAKE
jgi:elongation factor P